MAAWECGQSVGPEAFYLPAHRGTIQQSYVEGYTSPASVCSVCGTCVVHMRVCVCKRYVVEVILSVLQTPFHFLLPHHIESYISQSPLN